MMFISGRVRGFIQPLVFLTAAACTFYSHAGSSATETIGQQEDFDYAWLKGHARSLARQEYVSHEHDVPQALENLTWDEYQTVSFDPGQALWADRPALFRGELFHLGLNFTRPVTVYELEDGKAREIAYVPELFDYGESGIDAEQLPRDIGFAGFRFKYHTDWKRDVVSFLGASYFRAVSGTMQYGLSARGLAIDTALPEPEEFPAFTHFWLEKPEPNNGTATVYALLDSPSVTGAYQFTITPGRTLAMKVDAAIYPRGPIERLGIAPLTSMYMIGENQRRADWDWRPEIHDSDGLAMHTGSGQRIWRPLVNPEQLQFNSYLDENPKGFGLMQRDREFSHYQDDGVFYEQRPSLWVEPLNHWGKGAIQLVEIPAEDETFDNIVALWKPAQPIEAGQELLYSYNLYWGDSPRRPRELAQVMDTYTGIGGVVGRKREYYSKRFVVDFKGGKFPMLGKDPDLKAVVNASRGQVELVSVRPQHHIGGYRARFDVVPPDDSETPINLELHISKDGQPLTETWVYQWTPPPVGARDLHNPGHLE